MKASPLRRAAREGLAVVPPEALSAGGIASAEIAALGDVGWLPRGAGERLAAGFARFQGWTAELHRLWPREWPAPRVAHLCVARDPDAVALHFEPFRGCSWLLLACDVDPEISCDAWVAVLLVHAERAARSGSVIPALARSLPLAALLDAADVAAIGEACRRSPRPDAAGWAAWAEALPRVADEFGRARDGEPLKAADSSIPGLLAAYERAVVHAAAGRRRRAREAPPATRQVLDAFCDEWRALAAPVAVHAGPECCLWSPEDAGEVAALQRELGALPGPALASVCADLRVAGGTSARMQAELPEGRGWTVGAPQLDPGGAVHLDPARDLLVYDLDAPELERRLLPAPPLSRAMLAARTAHEWAHVAAAGAASALPRDERVALVAADERMALVEGARALIASSVPELRAGLPESPDRAAATLVSQIEARMPDWGANWIAARVLEPLELEVYVRNNAVASLRDAVAGAPLQRLVRLLCESQYLRLVDLEDPLDWLLAVSGLGSGLLASGAVEEPRLRALEAAIAQSFDNLGRRLDGARTPHPEDALR